MLLGKKEYSKRVVIGVHSAIFVPDTIKGIWKIIHDIQYKSILYKKFLLNARYVHVPNEEYRNLLNKEYGIPYARIVFIPNPINWETKFTPLAKSRKYTILWIGRLSKLKGVERLVEIIDKLATEHYEEFKNMEFIIASEGGDKSSLINMAIKKYLNVNYLHFVNDMGNLYTKVDLSIVTSYFETFGYSILEPQSFGIPVVSFDVAGAKTIIKEGKTGWIVSDVNSCARRMIESYYTFEHKHATFNAIRKYTYLNTNKSFNKHKIFSKLKTLLTKEVYGKQKS